MRDEFRGLTIAFDEPRPFDKVPGRISADAQLGKKDEVDACATRPQRIVNDFPGVSLKIANCSIDLPESDPHKNSVMGRVRGSQMREQLVVTRNS